MADVRKASFTFTKLMVDDLEKMAAYYQEVYGLNQLQRVQAELAAEPVDEIMMGPGQQVSTESLTLLKYVKRPNPPRGEVIVGFVTQDLPALLARAQRAGGSLLQDIREMPEHGVKVAFVKDPEGHLAEVVQLLG